MIVVLINYRSNNAAGAERDKVDKADNAPLGSQADLFDDDLDFI